MAHQLPEPYRGCTHVEEYNEILLQVSAGEITGVTYRFRYGTVEDGVFVPDADLTHQDRALAGEEFGEFLAAHQDVTIPTFQETVRAWFDERGWRNLQ